MSNGTESNNEMKDIWTELLSEFSSIFATQEVGAEFWNDIVPSSAEYPYIILDGESELSHWMTLGHTTAGESGVMIFHVINSLEEGGGRVCRQVSQKIISALHLTTVEVDEASVKDIRRRRLTPPFVLATEEDLIAQTVTFSVNVQYKPNSNYFEE